MIQIIFCLLIPFLVVSEAFSGFFWFSIIGAMVLCWIGIQVFWKE